jgi:5-formyltetrahydrofolate cyclo-ligase
MPRSAPPVAPVREQRLETALTGSAFPLPLAELRRHLRRTLRQARRELSAEARRIAGRRVCARLARSDAFRRSRTLSAYWPVEGELDLRPLVEHALALGKIVYLPIVDAHRRRLRFARYDPDQPLRRRRGLHEPHATRDALIDPRRLDLVLVPLVAFDTLGTRIGVGGGYYDRTFAFALSTPPLRRPRLVGVAYEFQRENRLERAPWDVPLDAVVTDRAVHRAGATRWR